MSGPLLVAAVFAGLTAVGVAAWYAAERAEAKARAVLDSQGEYVVLYRATYHVCPVCQMQRVPKADAPCAICVHAFHAELDQWGVTS